MRNLCYVLLLLFVSSCAQQPLMVDCYVGGFHSYAGPNLPILADNEKCLVRQGGF